VDQNFKKWGISAIEIEIEIFENIDFRFFGKKYRFRFRFEAIEIGIEIGIILTQYVSQAVVNNSRIRVLTTLLKFTFYFYIWNTEPVFKMDVS
jgi:hypothetical protein